jgi:hypothetical protein
MRHEQAAAFAAGAEAHLTGNFAVCAGSCGPGNLHLINGLFDCQRNGVPVFAIATHIPSSEIGIDYFQATHPKSLFKDCSHYIELVSNSGQLPQILKRAIRVAVARRGVAVVALPGDVAFMKIDADVPEWIVPTTPILPVPIQGPGLTCESFTAFALEASFFSALLFFGSPVQGRTVAVLVRPTLRAALAKSINRINAVMIGTMRQIVGRFCRRVPITAMLASIILKINHFFDAGVCPRKEHLPILNGSERYLTSQTDPLGPLSRRSDLTSRVCYGSTATYADFFSDQSRVRISGEQSGPAS